MKKIIIVLLMAGAGGYGFQHYKQFGAKVPDEIENPVYADVHVGFGVNGSNFELVAYVKTADQEDCQKNTNDIIEKMLTHDGRDGLPAAKIKSSECKEELIPRHAKLFDNKPSRVAYISFARGRQAERDMRAIFWGVTAEQSEKICDLVPGFQKNWKGAVTCIHPINNT